MTEKAVCQVCGFSTRWDKNGPDRMAKHFAGSHPEVASPHVHHEGAAE